MKRAIVGSAAAALLLALVVVAVVTPAPSAPPPVGPTQADLDAYAQRMLDATWASTGLAGDRPVTEYPDLELPAPNTYGSELSDCMGENGVNLEGWGWGPDEGYTLITVDGSDEIDEASQRQWYECVALHPIDSTAAYLLYTPAQRGASYDYQVEQVAPCLTLLGYDVTVPYPRTRAMTPDGSLVQWTAYEAVWGAPGGTTGDYENALALCGEQELSF